jgi:hypothetical protein
MNNKKTNEESKDSEENDLEDEEAFLAKYKLNGELPRKIPYSHEIFKPSPAIKWEDMKSFKEKLEKKKDTSSSHR